VRSYFLVVYYENNKRIRGGLITVIRNRIGGVFIIIALVLLLGVGIQRLDRLDSSASWVSCVDHERQIKGPTTRALC
jgi:drug/metabolite transporter superfamily protein YnfA